MSTHDDFTRRLEERLRQVRERKAADQEAARQAAAAEAGRRAEVEAAEEAWFSAAEAWRDNELYNALDTVRTQLRRGVIRNETRSRAYWLCLDLESAQIRLAIIPVPLRKLILLRATAEIRRDGIPTSIHDETAELPPNSFSASEPKEWIESQVIEMAAKILEADVT